MKSIIAMSLIGLLGLAATEAHAESTYYRCKVMACTNIMSPKERCEIDMHLKATITDFGDQFSIKYTQGDVLSPPLSLREGSDVMGKTFIKGKEFVFIKSEKEAQYTVIVPAKKTAIIAGGCEVIN